MHLRKPQPDFGCGQFCEHLQRDRREQTAAEWGIPERGATLGTEYFSAWRVEHDLDGLYMDAGPRSERDARAGTGEDGAGGMHDERGGAVNRWDDTGKRDNCGRGERFRRDYAELCGRGDAHAERADGLGLMHDDPGGCQCDDTVPDAVKQQFSNRTPENN